MTLTVRDATPTDYPVFAALFPALEVPDPTLTQAEFEARMLPRVVIAERDGDAVGYACFRAYGTTAHVAHVVADPRARRAGVGAALMGAVRERAARAGCTRWYLNVKKSNAAALALYLRVGMTVGHESWPIRADWTTLLGLRGTSGVIPFPVTEKDDADLARRFSVDAERIAFSRASGRVVIMALRQRDEPVAYAVFDPTYPGIYPIAMTAPELARPLFESLHPHARHTYVYVTVDGDRALADYLRAAGGELLFEILRMGGPLAPGP
jgi:ribosomal-protein-alanine N-acetyltransferase